MLLIAVSTMLMVVPIAGETGWLGASAVRAGVVVEPLVTTPHASCVVGTSPHYDAYDPVNHDVYVPNVNSGNVTVLNAACKVVATVTLGVGTGPWAAAFDPVNNYVYVTDLSINKVSVISGTSLVTTISDPSFVSPAGIAYEPALFEIVVANSGSDTISYLYPNSFTVFQVVTVGSNPTALLPFSLGSEAGIFVANAGGNSVSVVSDYTVSGQTIPVGITPEAMAFDPADQTLYVANYGSNNVTTFDFEVIGGDKASIPVVSHPTGIVWDQSKLEVYVADQGSSKISVIQGISVVRTITGPSGTGFTGLAYDDATDFVYVTAISTDQVFEYS